MMSILLPNLATFTKLIRQVSQEEVQIFLALVELVLEILIELLHLGLGWRIGHLIGKCGEVFFGVR